MNQKTDHGPRLLILIPNVWSLRNIVHSSLIGRLSAEGLEVHLVMRRLPPKDSSDESYSKAAALHELLSVSRVRRIRGKAFIDGLLYSVFMQTNQIQSYDIYWQWFRRKEESRLALFRSRALHVMGSFLRSYMLCNTLHRLSETLWFLSTDIRPVLEQLRRIAPALVLSVSYVSPWEHPYVVAAGKLGIPVICTVLSFDNLTSRTSYLQPFDHYLVWSEWMKDQLVRYYRHVSPDQVTVTGSPQFDFHRKPEFLLSKDELSSLIGIPEGTRYFLYAGSTAKLAPEEPKLVREVRLRMLEDPVLRNYSLVVRIHPLDDQKRWRGVLQDVEGVYVTAPWSTGPDETGWAFITQRDQAVLVSTVGHCEGCINIASTIALDAAILDRPVIGIDFHGVDGAPQDILYSEYYAEHYRPLIETGAVPLARDWGELVGLMQEAISRPEKRSKERALAVQKICGLVGGHAAERIAAAVLEQLEKLRYVSGRND